MAHRVATVVLLLAGLVLFPIRPLAGFIVLVAGLVALLDGRGLFGRGTYRSMIGFISGLWLIAGGAITTSIGMFDIGCLTTDPSCDDPEGNFLFFPGLLLLGLGLAVFVWSIAAALPARRRRRRHTEFTTR
ncbi:MAG TPA: hypothetical protein VJ850_07830 [Candidatus Limnocylindrales bacterium]|nr:hypothetical protein [Candidatus Limnocylindrales bacterium]